MALSKQTIRSNMHILVDGKVIPKDDLIALSEEWSETQENFFRKMLKQGGKFKISGTPFEIELKYNGKMRSDGTLDLGSITIPGEDSKF